MTDLIEREATLKKMCELCGYCERFEHAMRSTHPDFVTEKCNVYKFLMEQPTIEPEVRLIPKEVSATDIDKLTEMIKDSLLQAYPNDAMFTAVRHGRWIPWFRSDTDNVTNVFICSECEKSARFIMAYHECEYAFCPHCGAIMDANPPKREVK